MGNIQVSKFSSFKTTKYYTKQHYVNLNDHVDNINPPLYIGVNIHTINQCELWMQSFNMDTNKFL